jgi:hypothetical protein
MWKNTDLRYDINKRANIVIYRHDLKQVSLAEVDTKEVYNIYTDFDGYPPVIK